MGCAQLLARMLIAFALGFAAVLVAPTGAQAHAGHDHAKHVALAPVHHHTSNLSSPRGSGAAEALAANLPSARLFTLSASQDDRSQSTDSCGSGCCKHAGAGCCGAWLPPAISLAHPSQTRFALPPGVLGGAGITPDALPEPPKSLA